MKIGVEEWLMPFNARNEILSWLGKEVESCSGKSGRNPDRLIVGGFIVAGHAEVYVQ